MFICRSSMRDGGEQWTIQVNGETSSEAEQNWETKMTNKVKNLNHSRCMESKQWAEESIYRIPWSVKKLQRSAYQPQMVSIGPYHHGGNNVQLVGMEKHKERAFLNFIDRSKKPIQTYMDALKPVVEDLKNAYDQLQPKWKKDSEAFLQFMIIDGCFILELLRTSDTAHDSWSEKGYAYELNDKVFSEHGLIYFYPLLKRDMLMLENQLPMKLLTQLLATEGSIKPHDDLSKLILKFFDRWDSRDRYCKLEEFEECLHILDLYRKSLILKCKPKKLNQKQNQKLKKDEYIRSATELTEAWIRLDKSESSNLNDITFRCGVLKLPHITVDDTTETVYRNLMAFERCHDKAGNEVTSYVFLMDKIIDNAKDVSILHRQDILLNALGSDKAVARLFNSMSTDICVDPLSSLTSVHQEASAYCESLLRRSMAYAKHNYFTNPLVTLSVLAAIFLFALTGVQTAYSVLGYYNGDNGKNTTLNASKH